MEQPDVVVVGPPPKMLFMARLLSTIYGEERAAQALAEHFNLSSDATACILLQLHANDN